jgi:carboxypeptidase Taq
MTDRTQQLVARLQRLHRLGGAMALLGWDQEVTMPPGGAGSRAGHRAALAETIHELMVDPELGALLDDVAARDDLDPATSADVRELRRSRERAVRVPADLVRDLAEASALAHPEWVAARRDDDWSRFAPHLTRLVELKRREAAVLGIGDEPYDALLDDYEPGLRAATLEPLFADLRTALVDLFGRVATADPTAVALPAGPWDADIQDTLSHRLLKVMGYDFDMGRLDISAHPFTESMGRGDVRVTSRYAADDLLSGLTSTLHEGGHALYEQGLPAELAERPGGQAISLGIHESQSRLWENHVGRGLPFCRWLAPQLREAFPAMLGDLDAMALYRAANVVRPTAIRIESDEVTYNLHIALRFGIERALFSGQLQPADVPTAWRERARADLGVELAGDSDGALQDIHWCMAGFGYFPTSTLGNLYAAMFWNAAREALPDLDTQLAAGQCAPLLGWLREHIHGRGSLLTAPELCRSVTGRDLDAADFIAYLEAKHGDLT